ncbi:MAG: ABC-three component system protein [Bacteroidota bacterium]
MKEEMKKLLRKLHLPENIKANVMETMRGWFHESVLNQLDQGKAPVIAKKNFNEKLAKVIKKETDDRIVFLAKAYVKGQIAKEKVDEAVDRNFVRQLDVINHVDKHNIILDAIYDFLCSETERTRLTKRGDLTRQELEAIDEASKERWKEVFRRNVRQHTTSMSEGELADMAFSIYSSTIENYFSKIRGFDTEKYFTNGSFHRLSEDLEIGWHPNWESLFPNK